jgi:FkbM family methyltransferase
MICVKEFYMLASKLVLERLVLGVGSSERNVFLRRDSSDTQLVGQVFIDAAFSLSRLPRADELLAFLEACRVAGQRPLIVDGGANIGLSSLVLSLQCPDALVVAVEPDAVNFQLLVANTVGLPVLPLPAALGAMPGRCVLHDPGEGAWAYRTGMARADDDAATVVGIVMIDEILDAHADCVPFIVKLDIEGAEAGIFAAEAAWLDRVPLLIVEPHDWMLPRQRSAQPVFRRLARADRDFVLVGENLISMAIDLPWPAGARPALA